MSELYYSLLAFFWAFLIAIFAIPSVINVAHVKKLLDEPNLRTVHEALTPRLGGLAIFAGFLSAVTIFGHLEKGIQQLIAGSIVIFFIGLKDDIVSVSAFKKFFIQILAAGIVLFIGDMRITNFQGMFGIGELNHGISYAFSFLVIIGITNAFNLIDGLDGLAGTIVCLVCLFFGLSFLLSGAGAYSIVAFALLGSVAGFLRYNMHRAIIFMGDTGSLVSGFIIAVLSIKFVEVRAVQNAPAMALAVLFIPVLDTIRVFILRIFAGDSPFSPDKNHIHHKLVEIGFSHIFSVILLALINISVIVIMFLLQGYGNTQLLLSLIMLGVILSISLEILVRKKKKESAKCA